MPALLFRPVFCRQKLPEYIRPVVLCRKLMVRAPPEDRHPDKGFVQSVNFIGSQRKVSGFSGIMNAAVEFRKRRCAADSQKQD